MSHESFDEITVLRTYHKFVMLCTQMPGDLPGIRKLIVDRFFESNRKGFHRARHFPSHQGDNSARIHPSTQKRSERHIAHEPQSHGFLQVTLKLLYCLVFRNIRDGIEWRPYTVPVRFHRQCPAFETQYVPRRQLRYPLKDREWVRDVGITKIVQQPFEINLPVHSGMGQNCLEL